MDGWMDQPKSTAGALMLSCKLGSVHVPLALECANVPRKWFAEEMRAKCQSCRRVPLPRRRPTNHWYRHIASLSDPEWRHSLAVGSTTNSNTFIITNGSEAKLLRAPEPSCSSWVRRRTTMTKGETSAQRRWQPATSHGDTEAHQLSALHSANNNVGGLIKWNGSSWNHG